ncbi:uncharacterized protein T551_03408 [Pneumocystis jirovecii RU7]|uniref:SAP domain-containing protein n=1 Tax=Pneumocystis jirovecii (strain RU7) TaxID=1408657 RepID=A0A0W4ZDN0_PNEJ7|nr:uncharacterized protein T551_03408 [Pneumocystis jirovecii RU7]KTW26491.1 hypothetical protein T551_03408 [Pneumocystis jirovecii RU7]
MTFESYYRSLKIPALKELLQKRSLVVSGKKEDMIMRLLEADKVDNIKFSTIQLPRASKDDLGDLAPPEDEIDWGDDTTDTAIKTTLFEKVVTTSISDKLANSKKNFDQNNFQKIQKGDSSFKFSSVASAFSISFDSINKVSTEKKITLKNISSSKKRNNDSIFEDNNILIKNEIIKRKARALRFGIPENENNKKLERCARFGIINSIGFSNYKHLSLNRFPEKGSKTVKLRILDDPIENEKIKKRIERFGEI